MADFLPDQDVMVTITRPYRVSGGVPLSVTRTMKFASRAIVTMQGDLSECRKAEQSELVSSNIAATSPKRCALGRPSTGPDANTTLWV